MKRQGSQARAILSKTHCQNNHHFSSVFAHLHNSTDPIFSFTVSGSFYSFFSQASQTCRVTVQAGYEIKTQKWGKKVTKREVRGNQASHCSVCKHWIVCDIQNDMECLVFLILMYKNSCGVIMIGHAVGL